MMRRPLAEACERLATGDLRPLVAPDAVAHRLADGTVLQLRWDRVRGCWGGREGRALVLVCPCCDGRCRVLWRPPDAGWGCWRCRPVSHRSHRRPGARRGRRKPEGWRLAQLADEQRRTASLLGLLQWPPEHFLWDASDLRAAHRAPGAPRLCAARREALLLRLCALESLRVGELAPVVRRELEDYGRQLPKHRGARRMVADARRLLASTDWAVRRPAGDPRTARGSNAGVRDELAPSLVCDCNAGEVGAD